MIFSWYEYPRRLGGAFFEVQFNLNFFQKLVLCRGLDFAIPKPVSAIEAKASFEKAYWKLESHIPENLRDLAASTLRSVALNYIHRKGRELLIQRDQRVEGDLLSTIIPFYTKRMSWNQLFAVFSLLS